MGGALAILAAILSLWLMLLGFRAHRFQRLRSRYWRRWQLLSAPERAQLLYASETLRRRAFHDLERQSHDARDQKRARRLTTRIERLNKEFGASELRDTVAECPKYESFDEAALDHAFDEELASHWWAMRRCHDYDFEGTEGELDYLFNNREKLARELPSLTPPSMVSQLLGRA